jgi:chromosome segregation ATPase
MFTLITTIAVVHLRDRAAELDEEVLRAEAGRREVEARATARRADLAAAEQELGAKTASLAQLKRELADEEAAYNAIVAARDKALHDADAATLALANQLATARSDRAVAEFGRSLYEGYWTSARQEADRVAKDRDQAQHDRDTARTERDQFARERDEARAERDRLQADLEHARTDIARLDAAASERSARIMALERELAGSEVRDAGVRDGSKGTATSSR